MMSPTTALEAEARGWQPVKGAPWFYRMNAEKEAGALRVLDPASSYRVVQGAPSPDGASWYIYKKEKQK